MSQIVFIHPQNNLKDMMVEIKNLMSENTTLVTQNHSLNELIKNQFHLILFY